MYMIIQKGFCVFGMGETPEQALTDMKQWIDKDAEQQTWTVDDFKTCLDSANDGDFVLVQATKSEIEAIKQLEALVTYIN